MRRNFALTPVFIAVVLAATLGHAQSAVLDLPRDSQHAKVIQRVGITDITINYHRPVVKGRKVWGGLVPYGQVWRVGANEKRTTNLPIPWPGKANPWPRAFKVCNCCQLRKNGRSSVPRPRPPGAALPTTSRKMLSA